MVLTNKPDQTIRFVMNLNEATPGLKQKSAGALKFKASWDGQARELADMKANLARLATDQDRTRKNLAPTPREAGVFKTYLDRPATREREIDGLTTREKSVMAAEFQPRRAFEDFLANLSDRAVPVSPDAPGRPSRGILAGVIASRCGSSSDAGPGGARAHHLGRDALGQPRRPPRKSCINSSPCGRSIARAATAAGKGLCRPDR